MNIMIKLTAIGHLGKDSEVRKVGEKQVINFSVAHSEKYKDAQGNQQTKSLWIECAYWSDRTAIAQYLKKGTQVYIEGQPEIEQYTTNDGRTGVKLKCRVGSVQLLGSSNTEQQQQPAPHQSNAAGTVSNAVIDHDLGLPF
jgi:single-strand DNA-binding protein